jgi:PAS domain S-box-containing protein
MKTKSITKKDRKMVISMLAGGQAQKNGRKYPELLNGMPLTQSRPETRQKNIEWIFLNAAIGISMVDENGYVREANEADCRFLGYSRDELIGMHFSEFTYPEDLTSDLMPYQDLISEKRKNYKVEKRYIRKDGRVVWGRLNVSLTRDETTGTSYAIISREDVTDRKRDEERSRLLNCSCDLICIAGLDGSLKYMNPSWEKALGYTREHLMSRPASEFIYHEDIESTERVLDQLRSGKPAVDFENRYIRQDGSLRIINWTATLLPEEGLIYSIGRDITDRKLSEEALRTRAEEFEKAYKDMESFSCSLSHELREPLIIIDWFSRDLLKKYEKKLDADGIEMLSIINETSGKMTQLITNLLSFAGLNLKGIHKSPINMKALFEKVLAGMKIVIGSRNVQIGISDLPAASGDGSMICQVLVNLISNALKYTRPRERAKIEIGGCQKDGQTIYYVKDNGVGFRAEDSEKLFSFFQRLHPLEEFEGCGIGLVITKRIIEKHGGRVWAEGKLNRGATFFFSLPDT